ncbi:MAG: DUF2007 domain-containing protein [Bacteroidota bacterium]
MEDRIIVYKTFENPIEANIVMTRLQDAGYNCFLSGENTAGLRPLFDASISGIQLHVFEKDIAEINRFLTDEIAADEI